MTSSAPNFLSSLVVARQYESTSVGEEDLRQVQDCPAPRRGAGDLLESEAQAEAGVALEISYQLSAFSSGGSKLTADS
jgi:hypothetical protein